jgi:nanoRNase/pAp phosphatase (c-di-AMP/oligoRNAs hydrolase)
MMDRYQFINASRLLYQVPSVRSNNMLGVAEDLGGGGGHRAAGQGKWGEEA